MDLVHGPERCFIANGRQNDDSDVVSFVVPGANLVHRCAYSLRLVPILAPIDGGRHRFASPTTPAIAPGRKTSKPGAAKSSANGHGHPHTFVATRKAPMQTS